MGKKNKRKKSDNFQKCKTCSYFPYYLVVNAPYYLDHNAVKHRDIKYICQYDMHEIIPKTNICPRCKK